MRGAHAQHARAARQKTTAHQQRARGLSPRAFTAKRRTQPSLRSKTEDFLHLVPDREHEEDGEADEQGQRDDKAETRARGLAFSSAPCVAPRAVVVVRAVDRLGVDRRFFGRRDAPRRLSHAGSLVPVRCRFDDTFAGSG
jgi:hypothetical protein